MISRFAKYLLQHIDSFLMGTLLFTMVVGLFVLYSASGQNFTRVNAQAVNMGAALVIMWIAANISPQRLERRNRFRRRRAAHPRLRRCPLNHGRVSEPHRASLHFCHREGL